MEQFEKYPITFDKSCDSTIAEAASKRKSEESKAFFFSFLQEILVRLNDHAEEITEKLLHGKKPSKITAVTPDLGDPHNGSKTTVLLTLDTGKILYKPHDLTIDEFTGKFAGKYFQGICRIPKVAACGDGGFVEFIKNEPASTEQEAALFYEHLGGSCVLFQLLGSFDLHGGNLLAEKTVPVPVDLETITRAELRRSGSENSELVNDVSRSLYYSGLMPHYIDSERSLLVAADEKSVFLPITGGKKQPVTAYWQSFLKGYRTSYQRICAQKDEIRAELAGMRGIEARYLLRDTTEYSDLFTLMDCEEAKKAGLGGSFLFDCLAKPYLDQGGERFLNLAAAETKAMLRGDYPYFYLKGDSLGLWAEGKQQVPDFFETTCLDACIDRLDAMNPLEMEFECKLLTRAVSRTLEPLAETDCSKEDGEINNGVAGSSLHDRMLTAADCISYAETIFRQLDADKLVIPSGSPLWLSLNKKRTSAAGFTGRGFIDGTLGIALFFAAIYRVTEDRELKTQALALLSGILKPLEQALHDKLEQPRTEEITDISFASGYAGILFGLERIGRLTGDQNCMELCSLVLKHLSGKNVPFKQIDLMNGTAGLLKVICRSEFLWDIKGGSDLASQLMQGLISAENALLSKETKEKRRLLSGMAHGQAGIASALRSAYERLSETGQEKRTKAKDAETIRKLKAAIDAAYGYEYGIYSAKAGNWPDFRTPGKVGIMLGYCCGAPGIGWDAAEQSDSMARDNVSRAFQAVKEEWKTDRGDHLCCGKCASVDFLVKAYRENVCPDAEKLCAEILSDIGARIDHGELLHFSPSGFKDVFVPTLYYGAAGVGYEFLRFAFPDLIPSPLL